MPHDWEELEDRCFEHLQKEYGKKASILPYGKADSTTADIKISTASHNDFFVEVKAADSQCCQFVLTPNEETKKFDFSNRNKVSLTDRCQTIIDRMNDSFDSYCRVGRRGLPVPVDSSTLYGLVDDVYSSKGVRFFMTEGKEPILFPSERFPEYFDIKASYRRKTSGSAEPIEAKNTKEITEGLAEEHISGRIEYKDVAGKRRCFLHSDEQLHTKRMICEDHTYQFKDNSHSKQVSKQKGNVYEVRRLSNTCNPNVICQVSLKKQTQHPEDLAAFERLLEE